MHLFIQINMSWPLETIGIVVPRIRPSSSECVDCFGCQGASFLLVGMRELFLRDQPHSTSIVTLNDESRRGALWLVLIQKGPAQYL